ncbi:Slp family lipoprotein [Methylophaga sp. OBS4]|uniref:Slp family lipoprotein n=1 Tax=Methylophaga sp. OBS4 TaxID=2991935 RepID=UPI0022506194|nr:Slp family lipoprotein [Methylophaga sp. OBS4]MCX4187511.1 Slp family lipoprotein [Methylophaga sp. OBS4]
MRILLPMVLLMLTAACSTVPESIKNAPEPDIQLTQVFNQASNYQGGKVRWGGQVVKVENDDEGAIIHIAQFPLNSYGRPITDKDSAGRFLARSQVFVDPYIYKRGTLVTVAGHVSSERTVTIDKKQLNLPLVSITEIYRWTVAQYRDPYYGYGHPYYYDSFGYGRYYYPYRHYHHGYYWW